MKSATLSHPSQVGMDFILFENRPGIASVILPDAPTFTVVAVSNGFLQAVGLKKDEVVGKGHFEPFPESPEDLDFTGEKNIRAAFEHVIKHKTPIELPLQRYDIPNRDGTFAERYWKAFVSPVLNEVGEVLYIIHAPEEMTAQVMAERREAALQQLETDFHKLEKSEQRFRALVMAASNVIYRMSADWSKMSELQGRGFLSDTEEPITNWLQKYIHPKDQQLVTAAIKKAVETKTTFELEHQVVRRDGTLGWTFSRAIPILDDKGAVVEWFGAASDITVRKQTEEDLRVNREVAERQRRLYETITSNTPDLIYVFSLDYRFTYANKALLQMWGKTWDEAIGKGLLENGYEPWHAEMHHREIDQVVATKQPIRGEVSFPHATLGRRIYDYIFVPVISQNGSVEAIAGTTRDITDIKRAEEALRGSEQRQSFLLRLNDLLRSLTDPLEIQYEAASIVAKHLNADRVGYAEDGGDGKTVIVTTDYTNEAASLKGKYSYDDYGPALLQTLRTGQAVVRGDIATDPSLNDMEKAAHAALQLGATVNVPLLRNGALIAILFIHFKEAHQWTEEELALMHEVAERTWEAVVRARTEKVLRESEERFRIMTDAVPQSIWITDAAGRTEFLNKHWCDYSGEPYSPTTAAEIASKYLHPDDAQKVIDAFKSAMQSGEPFEVEQRNRSKEGVYRWFLNRATPYRDPVNGEITKWFGVGIDIHDRKLAEEALRHSEEALEKKVQERTAELEKANEDLKRSNKNLEQFAYAASHDLKEPTRKIHFFSERLKDSLGERMTGNEGKYFERMELASKRMSTLIDDLLAYSEVSQKAALEEEVDLNFVIDCVLSDLDLEIEQKGATIQVDKLFVVTGNRRQLQQAFQNLIGNALKYSKPDAPPVITIKCSVVHGNETTLQLTPEEQAKKYYQITVRDNGIGFDQEDAERIFNMFTRLHGNAEYKGTGVGLSIVQKVAENHGGYIWAESNPGEGALFKILLPAP